MANAANSNRGNENNPFPAHLRRLWLETLKIVLRTSITTWEDPLKVFRKRYVNGKFGASAKHTFH